MPILKSATNHTHIRLPCDWCGEAQHPREMTNIPKTQAWPEALTVCKHPCAGQASRFLSNNPPGSTDQPN